MCRSFSEFSSEIIKAKKYRDETKQIVDSEISEIQQDTKEFLAKRKDYLEKDRNHVAKSSEKINLAIEENDESRLNEQLNEMMSVLSDDIETKIKQEISDDKLKNCNIAE